eukprot:TRINITY_DN41681_c0_g1_i1.p1 TRINITY_DN41681_c0_g1~~TRINITY_DN41681_c0_g1_i1.p1  ORF type:complete len:282 (-),score=41.90 TRINITY_DN41681_c0_g1_i1:72-872(-)
MAESRPDAGEVKAHTADVQGAGLLSVGSDGHDMGKCKPCVFYHTKGCEHGQSCSFCHECPPQEAERRKRVRRQLLRMKANPRREDRSQVSETPTPGFKTGHLRQGSDASTTASVTSTRERHKLSHSRQSSGVNSLDSESAESVEGTPAAQYPEVESSLGSPAASEGSPESGNGEREVGRSRRKRKGQRKTALRDCDVQGHSYWSPEAGMCVLVPMAVMPVPMEQQEWQGTMQYGLVHAVQPMQAMQLQQVPTLGGVYFDERYHGVF